MASVVAQCHHIFGLRKEVNNNLCFSDEQTVVYPCGNFCVCYNTVQRCQRFFPGSEKSQGMTALAISANRRYLAVSECGEKATITVFDLHHEQGRKKKVLTAGDIPVQEFVCMAFSPDSKYLISQSGAPDWLLILWFWEKHRVLTTVMTCHANNVVSQVSFNPFNNTQLCVSGDGVFKLFRYSEGALKQSSFAKVESVNFLCHAWLTADRVIAGTDTGRLLVFESGSLRREISVAPKAEQEQFDKLLEMKKIKDTDVDCSPYGPRITAVLSYSKGFACALGFGTVYLFEKILEDSYKRSREIQIPSDPYTEMLSMAGCQQIVTMCMSPAEETLAISTDRGQMYHLSLSSIDMKKEDRVYFDFLSQSFHHKSITDLSICMRKPIVATSSLDRSVRIWNYETKTLELYKEFQEEAYSVALHPTGLFVLVGFSDKLRLMNLLIDDIRTFKEFSIRGCRECAFSNGGHMFAAVNGNVIQIYSVMLFENLLNLKGHKGKVTAIEWSLDDTQMVSCGTDGAVYTWNMQTGKRESEWVLSSCSHTAVAFTSDYKTLLSVGTDLTLKEIQDFQVLKEVPADELAHTTLAVSQSGRVVFTGTSVGAIRAIKYPLPMQKEWISYHAHGGAVTKMAITFDEQYLLTVSEDGCLLTWKIIDKEGRGLKSNRQIIYSEAILVTKLDMEEKSQQMLELKMSVEELRMENEYQLRLKDMSYNEKIRELTVKFNQQIKSLKTMQQDTKTEMEKQKREHQESSANLAAKHSQELKDLELSCSQKLMVEHERYEDLMQKYQKMQEQYQTQLKVAEESSCRTVTELTQLYDAKLEEKAKLLSQCQENAQQQILEFKEMMKQVEEDEEKIINKIQIEYEKKLHSEKESNMNLKGEAGIMSQKFYNMKRQMDDKNSDIHKLKQEQQRLLGLIRSLESDIEDLKRQISGLEKTNQDKDKTIANVKKKNMELEKLKFISDIQVNELKKQIEPQQDDLKEKRERIRQLEAKLVEMDKSNTQLKLTVTNLNLRVKTGNKEMQREMQKVKDFETHLQRLQSDLHKCVNLIQDPKKLKDSVQTIYARYVPQPDEVETISGEGDIKRMLCRQREHMEKTVSDLRTKLAKSAEEHEKAYVRIMKENVSLIAEINELRKELQIQKSHVKDYRSQVSVLKKSNRLRPNSVNSQRQPKQEVVD